MFAISKWFEPAPLRRRRPLFTMSTYDRSESGRRSQRWLTSFGGLGILAGNFLYRGREDEFTVEDSTTFTKPWRAELALTKRNARYSSMRATKGITASAVF